MRETRARDADRARRQKLTVAGLSAIVGCALAPSLGLSQQPVEAARRQLATIRDVNRLTNEEARRSYPVRLEGVATYSDPEWGLLFFEDRTGAIYINVHGMNLHFSPGARIRIDAVTAPGDIVPVLAHPRIRVLGRGVRPAPREVSLAELDAGASDSHFVMTRGVLRAGEQKWKRISYRIFDGKFWALLVIPPGDDTANPQQLVGAAVRIRGVAGSRLDSSGKRLGSQMFVSSLADIEVEQPATQNSFGSTPQPIRTIREADADARFVRPVHVRGQVTWQTTGFLFVDDGSGAVSLHAPNQTAVHTGDPVDIIGFPDRGEYGFTLSDSLMRIIAAAPGVRAMAPPQLNAAQVLGRSLNGKLVRIEARLIGQKVNPKEEVFQLADGDTRFRAVLPTTSSAQEAVSLPPGSILELSGIAVIRPGTPEWPASLVLLIESPAHIVVLGANGWLTLERVLSIGGCMGILVLLTLAWVTQLRRTVRRQTGTIRAKLEREMQLESQYRRLFERNLAAVYIWRPDGEIIDCNAAFAKMLGFQACDQVIGRSYWDYQLEYTEPEQRLCALTREELSNREANFKREDGATLCLLENTTLVESPEGTLYETTAIDVTQLRLHQADLQRARDAAVFQALNDPLTGLPNRRLLSERLALELENARRDLTMVAVLFIDLDGFKLVNDSLGHACGDSLLIQVASRLKSRVRTKDIVARLGGDEFTVVLCGLLAPGEAAPVAKDLLAALAESFWVEGQEAKIGASIGISVFPETASESEELLQQADSAMYAAKREGKNREMFYTSELGLLLRERLNLENQLRGAVDRGEISVHYQPEFDLASNRLIRFEALARWTHPTLGTIGPDQFIPVAEESGLIVTLGAYIMEMACGEAVKWQDNAPYPIQVAVNVSSIQFRRDNYVQEVIDILGRTGLGSEFLQIELTESVMLRGAYGCSETMRRLGEIGVSFAIDDFGTGYSCLSNLQALPFNALKIDRSFVKELDAKPGGEAMIQTVIELAHNMGMRVIVEGVESAQQLQLIKVLGADEVQGYLTGRPTANPIEVVGRVRQTVESPLLTAA